MNSQAFKKIRRLYNFWISSILLSFFLLVTLTYLSSEYYLDPFFSIMLSLIISILFLYLIKFREQTFQNFIDRIHKKYPSVEYSLSLFLKNELNPIERIQFDKIDIALEKNSYSIDTLYIWLSMIFTCLILIILHIEKPIGRTKTSEKIKIDSHLSLNIRIDPPSYTRISSFISKEKEINAPESSKITWLIQSEDTNKVYLRILAKDTIELNQKDTFQLTLKSNLLFKIYYKKGNNYKESDIYQISMIPDKKPELSVNLKEKQHEVDLNKTKNFPFTFSYKDDYGLSKLSLVLTSAKGQGESINFKEKTISLNTFMKNKINGKISYTINLNKLNLSYGNELYFYIEATDNRLEKKNISKSDHYFISIKDTSGQSLSFKGGMAVDHLPEYFMSQRKIIIETEKLIKESAKISEEEFFKKSNELAFNQKLLRRRYGNFLGEEFVSDIDQNFLKDYKRKNPNSKNLHFQGDGHDHGEPSSNNILSDVIHNHDKEEQNEFFDPKIKQKLKSAIKEMWNAELYLRLSKPKEALIYEYNALKWIKEVQQDSRIYVERIGFEAPRIKVSENRLKGDFDSKFKLKNIRKVTGINESRTIHDAFELINKIEHKMLLINDDFTRLNRLESYLIKHHLNESLNTLSLISNLISNKHIDTNMIEPVYKELHTILGKNVLKATPNTEGRSTLYRELFK